MKIPRFLTAYTARTVALSLLLTPVFTTISQSSVYSIQPDTEVDSDSVHDVYSMRPDTNVYTVQSDTELEEFSPVIEVLVPADCPVVLNPYQISIQDPLSGQYTTEQVVSPTSYIENRSNVDLQVSASVTGTSVGSARFSDRPITEKTDESSLFLYLELGTALTNDGKTDPIWNPNGYEENQNQLVILESRTEKEDMMVLPASDGEVPSYGAFRIFGDVVPVKPSDWTINEPYNFTVAFTFNIV